RTPAAKASKRTAATGKRRRNFTCHLSPDWHAISIAISLGRQETPRLRGGRDARSPGQARSDLMDHKHSMAILGARASRPHRRPAVLTDESIAAPAVKN